MRIALVLLSAVTLICTASALAVTSGTVTVGLDFSSRYIAYHGWHEYLFDIPGQVRFGVFAGDITQLDFRIVSNTVVYDDETVATTSLLMGIAPHFKMEDGGCLPFVEGFATLDMAKEGSHHAHRWGVGGSIGLQGHGHFINPRGEFMVISLPKTSRFVGVTTLRVNLGITFFSH
jgi:hypothetical protein